MLRRILKESLQDRSEEHQYLDLIKDILSDGEFVKGRNGVTKAIFGASMIFSLKDGNDTNPYY